MVRLQEKIYQLGFDEQLQQVKYDLTPAGFTTLQFPSREPALPARLGRFVREAQEPAQITSPTMAARYFQEHIFTPFEECDQEELWALLLNTKGLVVAEALVYRGTVNMMQIRLPELFKEAVRLNIPSIILGHNHPSGDPSVSPEDRRVTREADRVATLLSIDLHDHLVIGDGSFVSIRELLATEEW